MLFQGLTAVGNDLKINLKNVPWTVLGDDLTAYDCYLGIKADRSLYGKHASHVAGGDTGNASTLAIQFWSIFCIC